MDVKGAYLNAPIDKEIYVQQPPGYVQSDDNGTPLTCHLRKIVIWTETKLPKLAFNAGRFFKISGIYIE